MKASRHRNSSLSRRGRSTAHLSTSNPDRRRLVFEALEDRRMLAVLTVQNNLDDSLANLAGDGELSLREAIEIANNPGTVIDGFVSNAAADTIHFDPAVFTGGSASLIRLDGAELEIVETLTIDGTTGLDVTITADTNGDDITDSANITDVAASGADLLDDNTRVLNFSATSGDLTLDGLTITGGRTTGDNARFESTHSGGGIRFNSGGILTFTNSTLGGNSTAGDDAEGGGIFTFFGTLTLASSSVSGNSTWGSRAEGGGIYTSRGAVTLVSSTISGNSTVGDFAHGGGIFTGSGAVTLKGSTVNGNSTSGSRAEGGGIFMGSGAVVLEGSTVSGNSTSGIFAHGGGILTVSGPVTLTSSTVTNNTAAQAAGGGVLVIDFSFNSDLTVENSIIAGNTDFGAAPDLRPDPDSTLTVDYSLIGDTTGSGITGTTGAGNLLNVDPLLGPLADNGGPTQTHALLPGSPAIDAGDPNFVGPPAYDQRGFTFDRVVGGRIDIGAVESDATSADFDADGDVDGTDFLRWQRGVGLPSPNHADGDANLDGTVDDSDLALWSSSYGDVAVGGQLSASSGQPAAISSSQAEPARAELIDAAIALETFNSEPAEFAKLVEQPLVFESIFAASSPTANHKLEAAPTGDVEAATAVASADESDAEPWLDQELLQRVFT